MGRYNLCHVQGGPTLHGMKGYKEIIDSVEWGLVQLGHEVISSINWIDNSAINIVFGAQVLPVPALEKFPDNTIVYNLEQIRGVNAEWLKDGVKYYADRFRIWDYSEANLGIWNELQTRYPVRTVPIGYAPVLSRIMKPAIQDIDVLIYGLPGKERSEVFERIAKRGLVCVFVCGLYGAARDDLIGRSKVVVNVSLYRTSNIFEIARVSYLLANRKAVVAGVDGNTHMEDDVRKGILFVDLDSIAEQCDGLVRDEARRASFEEGGFLAFQKRDVRKILVEALKD